MKFDPVLKTALQLEEPAPAEAPRRAKRARIGNCYAHRATPATSRCAACQEPICRGCVRRMRLTILCAACRERIAQHLEAERATSLDLPWAVAGGLMGALAGGGVWALLAVTTSREFTIIAIAVGVLAAIGVRFATGGKRGGVVQVVAAACTVAGVALGKHFFLAHHAIRQIADDFGPEVARDYHYFSPAILAAWPEALPHLVGPYDIAFIALGIIAAWRWSAPSEVAPARRG